MDIIFNQKLKLEEIEKQTTLKVVKKVENNFLEDEFGNTVIFLGNGLSLRENSTNPTKILDELIKNFNIKFIDKETERELEYFPEKFKNIDIFKTITIKMGYFLGWKNQIIIPQRCELDYHPYSKNYDLPF